MPRQLPWQQPGYRSPSPADEDEEVIDSSSEVEDNDPEDCFLTEPVPGVQVNFEQWRQQWNAGVQARREAAGKKPLPVQSSNQGNDGSDSDSSDAFDPPPANPPSTPPPTLNQSKASSTTYEERIMVKTLRYHTGMKYKDIAKKLNLTIRQLLAECLWYQKRFGQ
ncbi:hypothetical protein VTH82DRAFT_7569 [Thermothelomyces myriococcoides]